MTETTKERRRLLVTGCPRSGTHYITEVFKQAGLLVEHESIGPDGCVSCVFGAPDDNRFRHTRHSGLRSEYRFDFLLHQVRHPLDVIPSMADNLSWEVKEWMAAACGASFKMRSIEDMAQLWVRWNSMIAAQNPDLVYRIEDVKDSWSIIRVMLNIQRALPAVPTTAPHRPGWTNKTRGRVEWSELGPWESCVRQSAHGYGYKDALQ